MNTTLYLHDEEAFLTFHAQARPRRAHLARSVARTRGQPGMATMCRRQHYAPTTAASTCAQRASSAGAVACRRTPPTSSCAEGRRSTAAAPHRAAATAAAAAPLRTVYAQEGSAIAASYRRARARSAYYYSVGKNRAAGGAADLAPPPKPRRRGGAVIDKLREATIPSYSMVDDGALCKVLIPFAGASGARGGRAHRRLPRPLVRPARRRGRQGVAAPRAATPRGDQPARVRLPRAAGEA